jgi:hypothetical protein
MAPHSPGLPPARMLASRQNRRRLQPRRSPLVIPAAPSSDLISSRLGIGPICDLIFCASARVAGCTHPTILSITHISGQADFQTDFDICKP